MLWFTPGEADGARARLMLATFHRTDQDGQEAIVELGDCRFADTFPAFAREVESGGFIFVHERVLSGQRVARSWSAPITEGSSAPSVRYPP